MLAELEVLTDGSQSDTEIMTVLASRYSPSVRIKPAAAGLGLLAWIAPMMLLTVGAVGVGAVVLRLVAARQAEPRLTEKVATPSGAGTAPPTAARAIVERELAELDD